MRESAWSTGLGKASQQAIELVRRAIKLLAQIEDDLLAIESSLFSRRLENDLAELARVLEMLVDAGFDAAVAYAEKAKLLARYAAAVRNRMEALHSMRGLSRVRDEIMGHIGEIRLYLDGVEKGLSSSLARGLHG
ncbi:hypothetical protein [Hyperthermus butylicus]|uniref:Uncharacterized protein n=1 Tax=Hyperthermus butylicus (strain DSM 5456 / JCM 9403 / PLM1-5) TaxID=415426 RepID=A2BLF8_HYPBU|nr:hypothetical protein [Hyperthermus butylicus]ABM80819.1 hypothetical protein Hbut_0971 [Hyperthermus butylicus DSM 5456]